MLYASANTQGTHGAEAAGEAQGPTAAGGACVEGEHAGSKAHSPLFDLNPKP
jgi:hypothetical protein